jgi:hypothetical protein
VKVADLAEAVLQIGFRIDVFDGETAQEMEKSIA